jgi:hypothetical protein
MATGEIPGTLQPTGAGLERPGRPKRTAYLDEEIGNIGSTKAEGADDAMQMTLRCGGRMGQPDAHADA